MSGLRVATTPISPPADLLSRMPDPGGVAMVRDGDGVIGWGCAARLPVGRGEGRFAAAGAALAELAGACEIDDPVGARGSGLVAFLAGTFDPGSAVESTLVVPEVVVGRRGQAGWVTVAAPAGRALPEPVVPPPVALADPPRVRELGVGVDEVGWLDRVAKAIGRIRAGELAKVVLARDVHVWAEDGFDPRALARRLATRFPTCHTFCVEGLVGASPELLIRRDGPAVASRVLAGTVGRDPDPATDAARLAQLRDSAKDRGEHDHGVASARAALAPVCAELAVDAQPWLLELANVAHLATDLRGRLAESGGAGGSEPERGGDAGRSGSPESGWAWPDALALVDRLHPTAAVCGTPTDVALAALRELESLDRARYAGPVGWVDARGDGEVALALRCAEVDARSARLFAGAGIVADSRPEAELEETRVKLEAMRTAIRGGG